MTTDAPAPGGPVGREQVVPAILEAAADLFAQRGPAATSIRDIAAASRVNHGLVFRHLGSKEKLVGAVLDHLGAQLSERIESGAPAEELSALMDRQLRVMTRALLDGYPAGQLQSSFPNTQRLIDQVWPNYPDETQARLAVANALALHTGWRLLGPVLRSSLGLDGLPEEQLSASIDEAARRLTR